MIINIKSKIINLITLLSWLTASVIIPLTPVYAQDALHKPIDLIIPSSTIPLSPPLDPDFDGIPTTVEEAGWSNESGGPYITNPQQADSDGDGLTDGYEQLYSTNPLDDKSPGLYVEYRSAYQTKKFYPWRQYGDKFIAHTTVSPSTERDVVVRRGTTLYIGGPPNANLEIIKSTPLLTTLNPIRNSCGGGWAIPIPNNSTLGTYTLRGTEGSWQKDLTLHVIFQLDTPTGELTQEHVDTLAYNDDLNNEKDLITIYWDTSYEFDDPNFDKNNQNVYGWAIGWETQYNQQYLLEDYVMPVIQGEKDRKIVAEKLRNHTNFGVNLEFNPNSFPNTTKNALKNLTFDQDNDGLIDADCNGHAAVLTTFLKAAGLTARPIAVDWKEKHYDTSTEVWLGNKWLVTRGYQHNTGLSSRAGWGSNVYNASNDLILVGGPQWEWERVNINYVGPDYEDYFTTRYESASPPQYPYYPSSPANAVSEIKRWGWVETPIEDYWGRPAATVVDDCSGPNDDDRGCEGGDIELPSGDDLPPSQPVTHPEIAHFGQIVTDYGLDQDGDGDYEALIVEVEVEVNQPGYYTIEASLNDTDPETRMGGQIDAVDWLQDYRYLEAGKQIIPLTFAGTVISSKEAEGPYVLAELLLTDLETPLPGTVGDEHQIDLQKPDYIMTNYTLADFERRGAKLSEAYTHQTQDTNNDGYIDSLTLNTTLDIAEADRYTVQADLTNGAGNIVASTAWTGTDGQVSLKFDALLASTTPYYLRNVQLFEPNHTLVDMHGGGTNAYEFDNYAYTTGPLYNSGLQAQAANNLAVTGATPNDSDADGDYDSLDFNITANILADGQYTLAGWLESNTGALVAWQNGALNLAAGEQTLTLSFSGSTINAFQANGPYKLIALKLANSSGILEKVEVAYETQSDNFTAFDSLTNGTIALADNVEDTDPNTYWNLADTQWQVTAEAAHTPLKSWTDSPASNYKANTTNRLTSLSINTPYSALTTLAFHTCYDIAADGDEAHLQVSPTGQNNWTTIKTYTNKTNGWVFEQTDFNDFIGVDSLEFRFNLKTNSSGQAPGWYIDDVIFIVNDDVDGDGITNDLEGAAPDNATDSDGDGTPDYLDTDSDNDTIPDSVEAGSDPTQPSDTDQDGTPDYQDNDSDNDTIIDSYEWTDSGNHDFCTNNAGLDTDKDGLANCQDNDVDGDGVPNYLDANSDGDDQNDIDEVGDPLQPIDTDGDGIPNYLDSANDNVNDGLVGNEIFLPIIMK